MKMILQKLKLLRRYLFRNSIKYLKTDRKLLMDLEIKLEVSHLELIY